MWNTCHWWDNEGCTIASNDELEWSEPSVWEITGAEVPNEPTYLVMNLAVGGVYPGPPGDSTQFPATFRIDSVTIDQYL